MPYRKTSQHDARCHPSRGVAARFLGLRRVAVMVSAGACCSWALCKPALKSFLSPPQSIGSSRPCLKNLRGAASVRGSWTLCRDGDRRFVGFAVQAPQPTGEAAELLAELTSGAEGVDASDYWTYGSWDLEGLRSDVDIQRQDTGAGSAPDIDNIDGSGGKKSVAVEEGRASRASWKLPRHLKAFERTLATEWILGTVARTTATSLNVNLAQPGGGPLAQGVLDQAGAPHISGDLTGRFVLGEEVHVRVVGYSEERRRLMLSMSGDPEDMRRDLQAQLAALELEAARGEEDTMIDDRPRSAPEIPVSSTNSPLGGKPLPDSQDLSDFTMVSRHTWLPGVVHHGSSFGLYVTVKAAAGSHPECWGIVHESELPRPSSAYQPGDVVQVRVAAADAERGELALSMMPPES